MSGNITHKGKISKVNKTSVTVSIKPTNEQCGKCAISTLCSKAEDIDIPYPNPDASLIGKEVTIAAPNGLRFMATLLFLLIPIILLIIAMGVSIIAGCSEGMSSIIAIASVVIWYTILYAMRIKIRQQAQFTIQNTDN